jgi:hypothetical protein
MVALGGISGRLIGTIATNSSNSCDNSFLIALVACSCFHSFCNTFVTATYLLGHIISLPDLVVTLG